MKRIAIIVVMVLLSLGASARSIHYFTYSQASRTVNYLNTQNELMIYCGYDYEIETYVLINEIWMERVNSSYYEIWIYGYDAYTGEEIYMPLDLQCVWLYSAGRMYNAAQYLRFRVDMRVPSLAWRIPPYNPYTRVMHRPGYVRTYHYNVHRHGWMPPAYTYGSGRPPMHPYYMRRPNTPAPMPSNNWTPGVDRPSMPAPSVNSNTHIGHDHSTNNPSSNSRNTSGTRNVTTPVNNNTSTAPSRNNNTTTPSRNNTTTTTTMPSRNNTTPTATTTPTRNTTTTTPSRNNTTTTTTPSRNNSSTTTTTPSRNNTSTTPSRNNTSTTTPSRNTTSTPSRNTTTTKDNNTVTPSRNSNTDNTTTTPSRNSSSTRNNSGSRNNSAPTRNR